MVPTTSKGCRPDDIEITPAMAQAGAKVLEDFDLEVDGKAATAAEVFRAMVRAIRP